MKKSDIVVIGGSAAGLVAATTAKSNNPEKSVTMIRSEEKVMIPCGIPYIFGTLGESDKNILPDAGLQKLGVEIIIDEVTTINKQDKICSTKNGLEISYNKLVIATGSTPIIPRWLKGTELDNVFTIPKNKNYLDDFMSKIKDLNKVIIVGAGFIGVEVADELNKSNMEVSLVEILPNILGLAFDKELAIKAEEKLVSRGINLITGVGIKEIIGSEKVEGVLLNNGDTLEADAIVLSMGYRPNTKLAEKIGLSVNEKGFIIADQYRRTECEGIFAVGDCAEKRDFATGKIIGTMLASTACAEARVAGSNLYKLCNVKSFNGTIGIYSTCIGETTYGVAGLTETQAKNENFEVVTGSFIGMDRHPGSLNNGHEQMVKLIVSKESGIILGGEAFGGHSIGELTNVLGFIIQNKMTVADLLVAQIGTQPMVTASPAAYPLIKAAEAINK